MSERMNQSGTGVELEGLFTVEQLEQIIMRMKFRQQTRREEYTPEYPVYKSNEHSPFTQQFDVSPAIPLWLLGAAIG